MTTGTVSVTCTSRRGGRQAKALQRDKLNLVSAMSYASKIRAVVDGGDDALRLALKQLGAGVACCSRSCPRRGRLKAGQRLTLL
jgi:hypothetical protein